MRSPVAMSKDCAPVLTSYSAITLFTSSMSAVAGSYSRSILSPWVENVRIFAFMFGLLWGWSPRGCTLEDHIAPFHGFVNMASSPVHPVPAVHIFRVQLQ